MTNSDQDAVTLLQQIVSPEWVKVDQDAFQQFGKDWTKLHQPAPLAIVFPGTIEEVQQLVRLANAHDLALVPSGGRTGLSGGAVAAQGEVVVAFDRMNKILDFDASDRQITCQAGVITEQLQQFAEDQGLFYPVDFASSGSSQIGGNVATNAGGIKVIRYGMTRQWVVGMKVVTGAGELLELNHGLTKNATGYDFRHLFVGSEGTLGFIVELTLALCNKPADPSVLLLGLTSMASSMDVLQTFQGSVDITAFEFFSDKAMSLVVAEKGLQRPLSSTSEFYALIEFENRNEQDMDKAMSGFEYCLEQEWVVDGTLSQSGTQARNLWRLREDISETIAQFTPYKNDISVKVSKVPAFLDEVDRLVNEAYPDFQIIWFGHIGDGNVHLNILKPDGMSVEAFYRESGKVSEWVFDIVQRYQGSVSAEHGVGLLKKPFLHYSRSDEELNLMRAVKRVFDPNNVMNPGKLLDC